MRKICPICGDTNKTVLKTIKMRLPEDFHLPEKYDVVACRNCGFCYAATEATQEDYDDYYSHCNSYSGTPSETRAHREYVLKIADLVTTFAGKNMQLLDMGFGRGDFMHILRKKGFRNVCGMDPSSDSVKKMFQEGFTVYLGSMYDEVKDSLRGKFDYVFCFGVLEHLLCPDKAVKQMTGYLKDGGYLFICVPDYSVLEQDESKLPNQFNREHINYFSMVSLDNLMGRNHFGRIGDKMYTGTKEDDANILALYKKGMVTNKIIKDEICKSSIMSYIERNNHMAEEVNRKLKELSEDCAVYVWGAGSYTMWLLANTDMEKLNIAAFIDNNPTKAGKNFRGKPIISADKINEPYPILVCCMSYSGTPEEIVTQIESICENKYLVL